MDHVLTVQAFFPPYFVWIDPGLSVLIKLDEIPPIGLVGDEFADSFG